MGWSQGRLACPRRNEAVLIKPGENIRAVENPLFQPGGLFWTEFGVGGIPTVNLNRLFFCQKRTFPIPKLEGQMDGYSFQRGYSEKGKLPVNRFAQKIGMKAQPSSSPQKREPESNSSASRYPPSRWRSSAYPNDFQPSQEQLPVNEVRPPAHVRQDRSSDPLSHPYPSPRKRNRRGTYHRTQVLLPVLSVICCCIFKRKIRTMFTRPRSLY